MSRSCQRTLRSARVFCGIGLHSGKFSKVTLNPASPNFGVVFRTSVGDVPAHVKEIASTVLTTSLSRKYNTHRTTVHTVEHLLAALIAYQVDNVLIEFSGSDSDVSIPILDGSAMEFADALHGNVIDLPETYRKHIVVRKPVVVTKCSHTTDEESYARLLPPEDQGPRGLHIDVTIDYEKRNDMIGVQRMQYFLNFNKNDSGSEFRREIAGARTFCFEQDICAMRQSGLIQGGSLDNAVVFGNGNGFCINPGGLRFKDEPCRHKVLDCIGDLSLCGHAISGRFESKRPGHELNRQVLLRLLSDSGNFDISY